MRVVSSAAVRVSLCRLLALVPQLHVDTKQYRVSEYDLFYY